MLVVSTGYWFSQNHQRFYCTGTTQYEEDGGQFETYSMSFHCPCGDPLWDGDPCCIHKGRIVPIHINCGTDKD